MKRNYIAPNLAIVAFKGDTVMQSYSNKEASNSAVSLGKENEITEQPSGSSSIWDEEE